MRKFLTRLLPFLAVYFAILLASNLYQRKSFATTTLNGRSIDSAQVLILGDSRGERNVDPSVVHQYTGLDCINLSEPSMDLYSLMLRLDGLDLKGKVLIISTSFFQINDAVTEKGYFKTEAFNGLTFAEKLSLYRTSPYRLVESQMAVLRHSGRLPLGGKDRLVNRGYKEVECKPFEIDEDFFERHPWYGRIKTRGARERLFHQALTELNSLDCKRIIVYNGPVSPSFKRAALENGIWAEEMSYEKGFADHLQKMNLKRIEFHRLIDMDSLTENEFYDPQHLCKRGAEIFSRHLAGILNSGNGK